MTEDLATIGATPSGTAQPGKEMSRRRLLYVAPAAGFIGLAGLFAWGLNQDPRVLPSALIGKPVPMFALPPVQGRTLGLANTDLVGQVSLMNVFASWCTACRLEHPVFMRLAGTGVVPLHGLNYKDQPADAAAWLDDMGDPYNRTGADLDGRVAIDWGVYGVPETYVVDRRGRIAHKHVGPVTPDVMDRTILPLVSELRR